MTVWNKLWSAVKGGVHETAEQIADSQALRILDQEIREADQALKTAYDERSNMAGKRKLKQDELATLDADIEKYLSAAREALGKGDEALAREVAERVKTLKTQRTAVDSVLNEYSATEKSMAAAIKQTEAKIEGLKREVESVKATEAVQAAQSAVASQHAGVDSRLGSAADSLSRIKEKQAARAARMDAAAEIEAARTGSDLDDKLAAAGIGTDSESVDDILASLK